MSLATELRSLSVHDWLCLVRPGDWLLASAGLAAVVALFPLLWDSSQPDRVVIRRHGELIAEVALNLSRTIEVEGPLGRTVIEIAPGRARVASDPSPRQYCVQQGWLTRANAVAICAPNHISLGLYGRTGRHDSTNY